MQSSNYSEILELMLNYQKGGILPALMIIVIMVIVGGGAYYLGIKQSQPQQNFQPPVIPDQVTIASPSPASSLPSGWTYQKSTTCDVSIPTPPKAEPYTTTSFPPGGAANDNNRYWKFWENTESEMFIFKDDAALTFYPVASSDLSNDYDPGSVAVFCAPNPGNLTTEQIISKLESAVKGEGLSTFEVVRKGQADKWGLDTTVINILGGMREDDNYILSANGKMYLVQYFSGSPNKAVKDTTKQIFDNLKFSN